MSGASGSAKTEIPAGYVEFRMADVGPLANLKAFDIRNGSLESARSLLVKTTIPAAYHWGIISGVTSANALKYEGLFYSVARARLEEYKPPNMSDEQLDKAALLIGVSRAVMTAEYGIKASDLIPGERYEAPVMVVKDEDLDERVVVRNDLSNAIKTAFCRVLPGGTSAQALTEATHMTAIGVLPIQGYSIAMTGHYYLSEPTSQSRRPFLVIERQNWSSIAVKEWFSSDIGICRDCLFHKAGHPVDIAMKVSLAFDESVPLKLTRAGAGPAAAWLPAQESAMRAASSYKKLLQTVAPLLESYGGSLDYSVIDKAVEAVKVFPAARPTEEVARPAVLEDSIPPYVVSRLTALQYLEDVLSRNKDKVAWCYGFYVALADQSITFGTMGFHDTLKTSYSLKKLVSQSFPSYVAGTQAFADFAGRSSSLCR